MRTYLCTRKRTVTITLTGSSGTANINIGGTNYLATFATDLTTTANNWITANAATLLTQWGLVATASLGVITLKSNISGIDFKGTLGTASGAVTIINASGNLAGTIATTKLLMNLEVDASAPNSTGASNAVITITPGTNANISISQIRDVTVPSSVLGSSSLLSEGEAVGAQIKKVVSSDALFIANATLYNYTLIACNNDYSQQSTKFTEV